MADETKKCAMDKCLCHATKDSKYCSPYCEQASGQTVLQCDCGHPACQTQKI